jgi:D-xylose transport system permease protein
MTTTPKTPSTTEPPDEAEDAAATVKADPGRLGGIPMPEALPDSTFGQYATAWAKRIRYGESGVLPVVAGLVVLVVIFQVQDSIFLSAGNITNLLIQGTVFILLGMAEVWVLVLGEIDLSVGFVAGIGAVITAILVAPPNN